MKDPHETKKDPFGHLTNPAHRERAKKIGEFLDEDAPFLRALDVGCSEGFVTAQLEAYMDTVLGIDVSQAAVNRAESDVRDCDDLTFEQADFLEYKPRRKFDLVVVTSMAHLFDDMPAFQEAVGRCLKKRGGRLLVSHVKSASDGDGYLKRLEASGFKAVRSGEFSCGGSVHSIHLLRIV